MRILLIVTLLVVLVGQPLAQAEVPSLIRYQGQAVDTNGVPLEGPYTLKFRLYSAVTGGTIVWEETQPNVPLAKGNFSVLLGSVTALNTMDWAQPCWLSVQVNGEPELAPRQQITSVPLALRAKTAEVVKTSGITDDSNRLIPTGAIILWNSGSCPAGYTRLSAYDGKFLVGSATSGSSGGSNTHMHSAGSYAGPVHTHSVPHNGWTSNGSGTDMSVLAMGKNGEAYARPTTSNVSGPSGAGPVSGTSALADSRPEFMTILLCQKD